MPPLDPPEAPTGDVTEELRRHLPIALKQLNIGNRRVGLVVVDEVNGFCTVGYGNLAPPSDNPQVTRMVEETDRLARSFAAHERPILAFLDTHEPGNPEPPYPAHCERGSGEEDLVPALRWLESCPNATLVRKDCINGFVGAQTHEGGNRVVAWVNTNRLEYVLTVGICTDICVMDFVLTMLSARNHRLMPGLTDVGVYEGACATYDLPKSVAVNIGLPETAAHPQEVTHHMGLYFMASRGAELVGEVTL